MNSDNFKKGQSLIELIIAIALFAAVILGLSFLIFDSYNANRLALEITKANFLAEEGLEAVKSIRDNKFSDLSAGTYGLEKSNDHWIFGTNEDLSSELNEGERSILVEDVGTDRKKITSNVTWNFSENRSEEIKLVTYLTNWQKAIEVRKPTARTDSGGRTSNDNRAYDYDNPAGSTWASTRYDYDENPSITFHTWESSAQNYNSLILKYRYHADAAVDDTYAVAYSTTGCAGIFTDLILPTSSGAPDATVSVNLQPDQNLSQICIKIYTERNGSRDSVSLYTRDIWTEGTY